MLCHKCKKSEGKYCNNCLTDILKDRYNDGYSDGMKKMKVWLAVIVCIAGLFTVLGLMVIIL